MKKLLGISLFAMMTMAGASVQAATAQGDAQIEVRTPLSVQQQNGINFGTVAVDATDTISMVAAGGVGHSLTCPTSWVCTGTSYAARFDIVGASGETVAVSATNATLSDGMSNTLTFVPTLQSPTIVLSGAEEFWVGGSIQIPEGQFPGIYSTSNSGGSAYTVEVTYQ